MKAHVLFILALIPASSAVDSLGCFSKIPSSFVSKGTYTWQTSSYCSSECSSYKYFALSGGNECYCGDDKPTSSTSSSSCNVNCVGYPQEKCGGDGAYTVYGTDDSDDSDSSSSSSAASSSTASSSSAESSSTSVSSSTASSSTISSSSSSSSNNAQTTVTQSSSTQSSSSTAASSSTTSESSSSSEAAATTSSSSSTEQSSTTSENSSTSSPSMTAQVLTSTVSQDGSKETSVIYVTQSTPIASASASASASSGSSNSKSSSNKGAIIGGAVGGAVGASMIIGLIFFLIFRKRGDNADDTAVDDLAYEEALKSNRDPFASPDDDMYSSDNSNSGSGRIMLGRRRLSDGSLADAADYYKKVLKVANPDDDKN
ncbi:hypothetical protein OGAPHI_002440 [Ogataea philodendri]|uniref:WSC domain-containing protein n=1 Tax=Ogataea philodendri TaxID=1378263 RepID=A0A9P8T7B4_9ASCO|nr:uncharacterized protein OGAPHI_002440 [Ogataea philodendri]KAH3668686.1 hypothetical protein OGAPHI_002440 [Ogataea philodendri]